MTAVVNVTVVIGVLSVIVLDVFFVLIVVVHVVNVVVIVVVSSSSSLLLSLLVLDASRCCLRCFSCWLPSSLPSSFS